MRQNQGRIIVALTAVLGSNIHHCAHRTERCRVQYLGQLAEPFEAGLSCVSAASNSLPSLITIPGFRTQNVVLATTLLDEKAYPDEALVGLYRRRWAVELFFRDIKTTLGMDVLRCGSPELVQKEIWMQVFGYNLVRALMLEAALTYSVPLDRLSFKGTVDTLRQWTPLFAPAIFAFKRARKELLRVIAADQVPDRPNRHQPRARKRRPKAYPLLTVPRRQAIAAAL